MLGGGYLGAWYLGAWYLGGVVPAGSGGGTVTGTGSSALAPISVSGPNLASPTGPPARGRQCRRQLGNGSPNARSAPMGTLWHLAPTRCGWPSDPRSGPGGA
jgi:hypothetical protein